MRRINLSLLILCTTLATTAQKAKQQRQAEKRAHINSLIKQEEEGVIAYRKSLSFGAKLLTDGYGIFFEMGRASTVKKSLLYQLEISERKHIKEDKQSIAYLNSVPFIYGKENFFYPVKLGVQQQVVLGNKSNKNGVSITGNYGGGIALGLLRTDYVEVEKNSELTYIKYDSPDSTLYLNTPIYGGPTFGRGWSELTVTPGLYGKTAVRFDYGAYNEIISAVEIGLTAEYYSKKVPILLQTASKQFFFSGYVAILFGKRK